jgi:hypothetical protein
MPLLGWDVLSQLKAQILLLPGNYLCCLLLHEQIGPTVWTDGMTIGQAKTALRIQIKLKNPLKFPHQKQYPLKPEGRQGLLPITNSLKKQGLLISCSSSYNTPILAGRKGPNKWRLVQDLQLINEAVIPLHPTVLNPYTLLVQILSKAQYYSVLDLKDALFCIPLHPDSQPLFAFEDPTNPSQQLTWTILPQGFRDSPHLFGQALTRDLLDWQYPEATLLQYVDDLLLCEATKPLIYRATESLLNFLDSQGYKVSKEKAQLCLPQVIYLGTDSLLES